MLERSRLEKLKIEQLFALALYTEEYNIRFFRSWANRLRSFDQEVVDLLTGFADDALLAMLLTRSINTNAGSYLHFRGADGTGDVQSFDNAPVEKSGILHPVQRQMKIFAQRVWI